MKAFLVINIIILGEYKSPKARMQIDMAINELFGSMAHCAYPEGTG